MAVHAQGWNALSRQPREPAVSGQGIEIWFDFASNYSYLSLMRIESEAARQGVTVAWKPFLLGPIFQSFGWNTSPFVLQKIKGEYVWKDMARLCRKYDLPWKRPSQFPRSGLLALRVALLGADEPWIGAFCRRIATINFAEDLEIESPERVAEVLSSLGLPAQQIVEAAQQQDNKLALRAQTEAARALGIFGAPTFVSRGEIFWGDDRLDDALKHHVERCG